MTASVNNHVLIFPASTRLESMNRKLAIFAGRLCEQAGLSVTHADLRHFPMPLFEGDYADQFGAPPEVRAFQNLVASHAALIIASPEYNGSFSALLKNAIDWISIADSSGVPMAIFQGKWAGIMSASPGRGGGRRGLRHLRELLEMVGVHVVAEEVAIAQGGEAFDTEGNAVRTSDREAVRRLVNALAEKLAMQTTALQA